jgi:hypothetical protein
METELVSEMLCFFNQTQTMDSAEYMCQFNNSPSAQTFRLYKFFFTSLV